MSQPVDQELIARCLAGSDSAWAELVDRYSGLMTTHSTNIDGINPDYAGQLGAGRIDAVSAVNVIDASPASGTSATPRVWLNLFNTH